MKLTKVLPVMALVLILASSASAFDGLRKGFVLGGGLGVSPAASWATDTAITFPWVVQACDGENNAGVGMNIIIGYAWDEYNMIVYEGNVAGWKSDAFWDQQIGQGFNGAAWYHYFGPVGKSFFTAVGLGGYVFDVEDWDTNDMGGAFLLGAGYEFARHFQVAGYVSAGKSSIARWWTADIDFTHAHFNLIVSGVAF